MSDYNYYPQDQSQQLSYYNSDSYTPEQAEAERQKKQEYCYRYVVEPGYDPEAFAQFMNYKKRKPPLP
jgi:hypothetical protein